MNNNNHSQAIITTTPMTPGGGGGPLESSSSSSECGDCGAQKRWILHHVRIRGHHRRLCTSCVLRLHPSSFCPSCFQFYDPSSLPAVSKRLTCSKCASFTHSHCLPSSAAAADKPFLCPPCSSPSFSFFDAPAGGPIDKRLALVLLCAAKISAASMSKAVVVARAEAERRVREAAAARKRARDAIENLAVVIGRSGEKAPRLGGVNVNANANGNGNVKDKSAELVKKEKMDIDQPAFK